MTLGAKNLGKAMSEYLTRSFGTSNGLRDDAGLMRVVTGDAGEPAILAQRQHDAILLFQLAHPELVLKVGLDEVRFSCRMLIVNVVATLAELLQVADQSDGLEICGGFIRFPSVTVEAFFRDNLSGRVQLVVWIQSFVLPFVMTAETEADAILIGSPTQG